MDYSSYLEDECSLFGEWVVDRVVEEDTQDAVCLDLPAMGEWQRELLLSEEEIEHPPIVVMFEDGEPVRINVYSMMTSVSIPYYASGLERCLTGWMRLSTAEIVYEMSLSEEHDKDWYYVSPEYGFGVIFESYYGETRFIDGSVVEETSIGDYTPMDDGRVETAYSEDDIVVEDEEKLCTLVWERDGQTEGLRTEMMAVEKQVLDVYESYFEETVTLNGDLKDGELIINRVYPIYDMEHAVNTFQSDKYTCEHLTDEFQRLVGLYGM